MAKVCHELGPCSDGEAAPGGPGSVGPGTLRGTDSRRAPWPEVERVPVGLLVPRERPARPPLPEWIAEVERALDAAGEDVEGVLSCFGQAARIERCFGRLHVAESGCAAELRLVREESARRGDPAFLARAFEPWIELSRLDRLSGKEESSLRKLSRLPAAARGGAIALGAVEIRAEDWPAVEVARPGLAPWLDATWIAESLETMLAAKSFQRAFEFTAREPRPPRHTAAPLLAEARIVALCHLGRRDAAWDEAARHSVDVMACFRPVFTLRAAQALACFGVERGALDLVRDLADLARGYRAAERPNTAKLDLIAEVAALASTLGARDIALELAEEGLAGATHHRDEPLQGAFLTRLAALDPRHREALHDFRRRTWYASLRTAPATGHEGPRSAAPDPARIAVVDRLTRRLLGTPRSPLRP
ncbi:MAG: hypothetical protein IT372_29485 [Polyangiaceae bacterium]|nr:hypothetical protein [Polyangiaceae bacterium]